MLTSIQAFKWVKDMLPILVLAYTTNVVIVCLPYIIQLVQRETEMFYPKDEKLQSQIQGTVSVVFNLPLGSLFITVFVFFASLFYNTPLSMGNQLELFFTTFLTSLGGVGLGSWINSLTFLLDALNLPLEALNIYLVTLPFTSGFQSMLSAIEIASLSLFITLACRQLIKFRWQKILRGSLSIAAPVFLIFCSLRLFNPLPKIQNQTKSIYEISIAPKEDLLIQKTAFIPTSGFSDPLDRILYTKTLRVGYHPEAVPFCFKNHHNEIVGYDVAFAYELAKDLGCRLELVPLNYARIADELEEERYDIAMSAVSITEKRLQQLSYTHPYVNGKIVLLVRKDCSQIFSSLEKINSNPKIKIAAIKGSSYEAIARRLFPYSRIVLIDDFNTFESSSCADALIWQEQEAVHSKFSVASTVPSLGVDTLAYAVSNHSEKLLNYLNQWLQLKEAEGFTEKQYNLWVLGKTSEFSPIEPRWSFIRNVLHWTN
jgi:ABC-type amino acid transport substrate-binding protein